MWLCNVITQSNYFCEISYIVLKYVHKEDDL